MNGRRNVFPLGLKFLEGLGNVYQPVVGRAEIKQAVLEGAGDSETSVI